MIRINNVAYDVVHFEHGQKAHYESLHVIIKGDLRTGETKLNIEYEGESYYGCKLLKKVKDGVTDFFVYIFQKGDSE